MGKFIQIKLLRSSRHAPRFPSWSSVCQPVSILLDASGMRLVTARSFGLVLLDWIGLGFAPSSVFCSIVDALFLYFLFFYPVLGESEFCGPQLPKLIFTRMIRQEGYGIGGLIPRESVSNMFNRGLPQQQGEQQCIRQQ